MGIGIWNLVHTHPNVVVTPSYIDAPDPDVPGTPPEHRIPMTPQTPPGGMPPPTPQGGGGGSGSDSDDDDIDDMHVDDGDSDIEHSTICEGWAPSQSLCDVEHADDECRHSSALSDDPDDSDDGDHALCDVEHADNDHTEPEPEPGRSLGQASDDDDAVLHERVGNWTSADWWPRARGGLKRRRRH